MLSGTFPPIADIRTGPKHAGVESVPELISRVRDHYLRQFVVFVGLQREQWSGGHAEVKIELSDQSELFRRLYCTDFAAKDGDAAIVREMYPDKILTFEPIAYEVRGVPARIERLVWDDVQIHHDAQTIATTALDQWFDYWFDPADARVDPTSDIGGIVHSLFIGPGVLNIDLGTATTEAFWDALDLVVGAGATNIRITSDREGE